MYRWAVGAPSLSELCDSQCMRWGRFAKPATSLGEKSRSALRSVNAKMSAFGPGLADASRHSRPREDAVAKRSKDLTASVAGDALSGTIGALTQPQRLGEVVALRNEAAEDALSSRGAVEAREAVKRPVALILGGRLRSSVARSYPEEATSRC